jgi:hypothetical protein
LISLLEGFPMNRQTTEHDPASTEGEKNKQTDEPWKQPVEKEQDPGKLSPDDLERWQKTKTH